MQNSNLSLASNNIKIIYMVPTNYLSFAKFDINKEIVKYNQYKLSCFTKIFYNNKFDSFL